MKYPAQESLRVAAWHHQKGDHGVAETICRSALAVLGASPPFSRILGLILFNQGQHAEAARHLRVALAGTPADAKLGHTLLLALYLAKDWQGVVDLCTADFAARLEAAEALRAFAMVATAHIKLGRESVGRKQFRKCLDPFLSRGLLENGVSQETLDTLILAAIGANDTPALTRLVHIHKPGPKGEARPMGVSQAAPIAEWCAAHGVRRSTLDPEQTVKLPPAEYSAAECWTARLPRATMVAGWDFPITEEGVVLVGGNYLPLAMIPASSPHYHMADLGLVAHVWPDQCTDVDEDALFLSAPEGMHFGHWLVDFLPRLRGWKRPMKVAIPDTLPAKHRDTLACFGVEKGDLVECSFGGRYRFRSLTVVVTGDHQSPQPANPRFVYQGLSDPRRHGAGTRRLFVNRGIGTRQIANRDAFDPVLKSHGITEVDLAKISIADQRTLLGETELVIGVYGSDLYCMFMLPAGAEVVELVSEAIDHPVFARYAAILGMRHHLIQARSAKKTGRRVYKKDHDLDVDCEELSRRLDEIAARRAKTASGGRR